MKDKQGARSHAVGSVSVGISRSILPGHLGAHWRMRKVSNNLQVKSVLRSDMPTAMLVLCAKQLFLNCMLVQYY